MNRSGSTGKRSQMIGSAAARLISHKWACPDCADAYGCHAAGRGCEICSPPRNPVPVRRSEWDDQ